MHLVAHVELDVLGVPGQPIPEGGEVQDAGDVEEDGEEDGGDQVVQHQSAPPPAQLLQ